MQLRSKYYTYPVITDESTYYENSSFSSSVEHILDGYNIRLILHAKLINNELEQMLEKEEVLYAHHIECSQTCFRRIILTKDEDKEFLLKNGEVNGLVQICTFLVATKKIEKYNNKDFTSDFRGFRFDIERGCVLAVGNQVDLRINKTIDDLANTSSIFSIVPNLDETITNVLVNTSQDKIVIAVPKDTFSIYSNMSLSMDIQPVMHSMLIIPSLAYALNEIKDAKTHLYDYEELRWYNSIKKATEKMNITLTDDNLDNIDSFELAQKLLDSPIPKAMNYLKGDYYEDN